MQDTEAMAMQNSDGRVFEAIFRATAADMPQEEFRAAAEHWGKKMADAAQEATAYAAGSFPWVEAKSKYDQLQQPTPF